MKIGIDFDRVIFDTDSFKEDLNKRFPEFSSTYDDAKVDGYYNLEKHAELMGIDVDQVLDELEDCSKYVYSDIKVINSLAEFHEIIIVTRGDPVFQKEKLEKSGVLEYVDDYVIVTEGSKQVEEIEILIDDRDKEINNVDIPGINLNRPDNDFNKLLDHLNPPEFQEVFKRYDIRGRYTEELNEYFSYNLGRSIAKFAKEEGYEKIVACKDTKESSDNLKKSLIQGILSEEICVVDTGEGSTDYTSFCCVEEETLGVQVTSSHMPLDFNGFKFIYAEGNGFKNEDLSRIKQLYRNLSVKETRSKMPIVQKNYTESYDKAALNFFKQYFDEISKKIVVHSLGGKNSNRTKKLLEELGAEVIDISENFPQVNPPNPKPSKLKKLEKKFVKEDADLGVAFDLDSDRVAVYHDESWLSGDEIFSVLIDIIKPEITVSSVDCASIVQNVAEKYGDIHFTRVGDPFVIGKMIELNSSLSGEPNGHYCFPDFVPYNSGTMAALLIAGSNLNHHLDNLDKIKIFEDSIEVENKETKMNKLIKYVNNNYEIISKVDGVKFSDNNCIILLRTSGSSQKIRIKLESNNSELGKKTLNKWTDIIRNK